MSCKQIFNINNCKNFVSGCNSILAAPSAPSTELLADFFFFFCFYFLLCLFNEVCPRGRPIIRYPYKLVFRHTSSISCSTDHCTQRKQMENNHPKPHAVLFPYPLQGHVIPTINLAMKLASKGFTITFVNTEWIHHQITNSQSNKNNDDDIFAGARKSGLDIRYVTISDGFPKGYDRSLNQGQFWEGFVDVFPAHVNEVVGNLVNSEQQQPPVTCLIADTFFGWSSIIARKYNLVNISFWTEPALVFTLFYHLDLLIKNGHFASYDNREDTIDYIPGVEAIEPKDLMSMLQTSDTTKLVHKIIYKAFDDVKKADFVLCNTVQELESQTISALQEKQAIYSIGPIFPSGFSKSIVAANLWSESDCTEWLSTKTHGSVLYVSFGSTASTNEKDIAEIAFGLVLSKVSFIWVLRESYDISKYLPDGYEDEIKEKGIMLPWCSQIDVISHPAIGGFLTHCGWNSLLESMWCGLPFLCYPLAGDQLTNRKLVVDDWKVGINLCDRKPLLRIEVAEKINRLMSGKSAEDLSKEMIKTKQVLRNALANDGSSENNLNEFICNVKTNISNRT